MLGFLSVSTLGGVMLAVMPGFNPVLGFLSVSTWSSKGDYPQQAQFQSRAGFSECLDELADQQVTHDTGFQSRAGFSECLDLSCYRGLTSSRA